MTAARRPFAAPRFARRADARDHEYERQKAARAARIRDLSRPPVPGRRPGHGEWTASGPPTPRSLFSLCGSAKGALRDRLRRAQWCGRWADDQAWRAAAARKARSAMT